VARIRNAVRIVARTIVNIVVRVRRIVATSRRDRPNRHVLKAARSLQPDLRFVHQHRTSAQSARRCRLFRANHQIVQKAQRAVVAGDVAGVVVAQAVPKKAGVSVRKAR